MKVFRMTFLAVPFLMAAAVGLNAQATRTWVSGVGDDANPCSRTAPCKTFAGAISKTAAGGEISVLDPGGFGSLTITKSIVIDGEGTLAGVLNSSTNGIVIAAGQSDVVVLKRMMIDGGGTGLAGIRYMSGAQLIVEDSLITGQTQGGIEVAATTGSSANLVVRNTSMNGGQTGVKIDSTSIPVNATLSKVSITGSSNGVEVQSGNLAIIDSIVTQNTGTGLLASGGSITGQDNLLSGNGIAVQATGGSASIDKSMLSGNGIAVQAQNGATIRISNNSIYNNQTGVACGGTVASTGDNRKGSNVGGSVAVCAPNASIALQ